MRHWLGLKRLPVAIIIALSALSATGAADGPDLRTVDSVLRQSVAVAEGTVTMTTWLQTGPEGLSVTLQPREGAARSLTIRPFDASLPPARPDGTEVALPGAGIELVELRVRRYLRPNPAMLKGQAREDCLRGWADLPSPARVPFSLTFTHGGGAVECYLDGRYAGRVLPDATLRSVEFALNPGSAIGQSQMTDVARDPAFQPIDLTPSDRPGELDDAQVTLTDPDRLRHIPFAAPTGANLDLGPTARHQDLYGSYTCRSAFDALGESHIFTVPSAQYIRAWVLCAVEPDPAKDPAITARLTRFVSGGPYTGRARDCLADTTIALPRGGETPPAGIVRVGAVAAGGQELPLYLVEMPLASGDIQDLIFHERDGGQRGTARIGPYLDFELLGRLRPQHRPHPFNDDRLFPDRSQVSGVHVFGVTLERTPVEMEIRQSRPGNVFHNDETPELVVALRPQVKGQYALRWTIREVDDSVADSGEMSLSLDPASGEQAVPISLRRPQLGWYGIECALWQGERALLSHRASFALLGPDTRQAGYESPYGTWWFDHHYGCGDPGIIGPLLLKAGFRRAAYATARHSEEELAPWKVTAPSVSWGAVRDPALTDEQLVTAIRDTLARHPHCGAMMIFHESMPGAPLGTRSAPELFGLPVNEYPGADERWRHATRLARLVREHFPDLKIYIGNSGASSELIAEGLRRGFPRELADYIGIETVGRTGHPEKLWEGGLPGVWLLREIARRYDYDWGVTSCYETNYRHDRLLGEQRQAEWYVRDALLSHAYRFPYISIALLHDTGNSYHGSFWGATGLCRRYPLLYPKRSYVAMATLTQVLDRVELRREVPTGSNCVYALEFARADGSFVYPVWTARGLCELQLTLPAQATLTVTDLYGREQVLSAPGGMVTLTASGSVQYAVSSAPLTAVSCGRRFYPEDYPPVSFRMFNAMDRAEEWELATGADPLLEQTSAPHLAFRTAGEFALRGVTDDEHGPCLEVELLPAQQPSTPLLSRYGVIRLKQPITLPGEPTTLGVWVKGNSGWGEVYWEIEDAAGVRRVSCGTTVHDADVFDYDGRVSINFDGWAFLSFPITNSSPIPDLSTGSAANLWQATDRSKPVTYPIKLTGLAFSLPHQALHLTEMAPVHQVIRLGGVGAF